MKTPRSLVLAAGLMVSLSSTQPVFAHSDDYDDSQSHPLRIAAYLMRPAAWLVEWTVFRPFHFLVSATEPTEAFFGHNHHPPVVPEAQPIHDYGVAKRMPTPHREAKAAPTPQPTPVETVKIVEVPVEKVVVKEVEKIVEVEKFVFPAVAFEFDSAFLTDLGKGQVYLAAQKLKEKNDITVVIEGHTDNRGEASYNQKLGMQRADTVMNELASFGIDRSRMSAATVGEARPAIDQDTRWARATNRRVEFRVKAAR